MALQVLVKEFVGYSALFLRTIEGKPTLGILCGRPYINFLRLDDGDKTGPRTPD